MDMTPLLRRIREILTKSEMQSLLGWMIDEPGSKVDTSFFPLHLLRPNLYNSLTAEIYVVFGRIMHQCFLHRACWS